MGYFAKVLNAKVLEIIVADESFFDTFVDTSPGTWWETSYNTHGGIHYGQDGQPDGGLALRANYAGIGYTFDESVVQDGIVGVFYTSQPYPSWTISAPTWVWQPPVPYPASGGPYIWDEATQSWIVKPT